MKLGIWISALFVMSLSFQSIASTEYSVATTTIENLHNECEKCGKEDCKGNCDSKAEKKACSSKSESKACCSKSKKKSCSGDKAKEKSTEETK